MEQIEIGGSGIKTSRIALGTWAIGGWMWGGSDDADSISTIHSAVERGISLIDTAPVYGFGHAEEVVGKAIAEAKLRDRVRIATKVGLNWSNGKIFRDSRPARIRQEVEDSLRRLRTDRIDLYQIHWPDLETDFEQTARTLGELKQSGKILAIGVSNFSPEQMDRFRAVTPIGAVQPPYNLFEREIEAGILPYAAKTGLTVLSYGALCRGLLSGKMTPTSHFSGDDLRRNDPKFQGERFRQYLRAVDELAALARSRFGKSVLALAVRWILDQGPTIALWGARHPGQLDPVGEISGWTIDDDTKAEIDAILAHCIPAPIGPEFMAPPAKRPEGI